jgi:hypothetical protein
VSTAFAEFVDRLRRYAANPRGLALAWRGLRDRGVVARSPLFDRDWYLREHPDVGAAGVDPALHYLVAGHPAGLDPGPGFCGAEYAALNGLPPGANPLARSERSGRRRGCRISFLQPEGGAGEGWRFPTLEEHQAAFPAKAAAIGAKVARGERVRAVFFVGDAAMFPARALFDAMRRDPRFDARLAVVPDLRGIAGADPAPAMERCRAALAAAYPAEAFLPVARGADGRWPDVLSDFGADLVCHPSPYELSDFRYNPRWCVGRPFLPIHVNYGYYRSVYDRHVMAGRNYALFWKAFFECDATLAEYRGHSVLRGANAEVVGYVPMDALASFPPNPGPRKRVLLCPHHSVEGGANDALALSNFLRYADFLADLPARFPELDFLLRPHPFLFPVLSRPKFWGPAKCAAWRERFLAHPNAAWTDGGDHLREFAASDAIVQDCGSFLVEWFYTGKPCCYLLKSEADLAKFAPLGRECLKRCAVAYDEAAIEAFLRDVVLGGRDALAAEREAFRRTVAVNHPHAAAAALAAIVHGLGIG